MDIESGLPAAMFPGSSLVGSAPIIALRFFFQCGEQLIERSGKGSHTVLLKLSVIVSRLMPRAFNRPRDAAASSRLSLTVSPAPGHDL